MRGYDGNICRNFDRSTDTMKKYDENFGGGGEGGPMAVSTFPPRWNYQNRDGFEPAAVSKFLFRVGFVKTTAGSNPPNGYKD